MIRGRAVTNTKTPPGEFRYPRYLRDEIERIERQEGIQATIPLTAPENGLEGLKQALLGLCDAAEGNPLYDGGKGITPERIRRMVSKY